MIKFADIEKGNLFDIQPNNEGINYYTFWFDDSQSVGLNYVKNICIVSDKEQLTVNLDSDVFYLLNVENRTNINVNDKEFFDLDSMIYSDVEHKIKYTSLTLNGTAYNDVYVYMLYILAKGEYVGSVTDNFYIDDNEYTIGADFYDANESLGINIANFGLDISNEVQRAIYEMNIDEQKPDYILLNRKFKELLEEYINILANKGSYKSLINSLNWFEYGKLVKLLEYWRYDNIDRQMLAKNDLTQYITNEVYSMLTNFSKTTYIGLYCALEQIKVIDGEIQYQPNKDIQTSGGVVIPQLLAEPIPVLEEVTMKWSKNDMSLKMTLLGNFFATYFLPIHLHEIHSTIENIIYTNTLKIASWPKIERFDYNDDILTFDCKLDDTYHLTDVYCCTNLDTPFGFNSSTELTEEDEDAVIFGVDTVYDVKSDIVLSNKGLNISYYKGVGAIVHFDCTINNVKGTNTITDANIRLYHISQESGELITIDRNTTNINHVPENNKVHNSFDILLTEEGDYKIQLAFRRSDGVQYIKVFDITVDGDTQQSLSMYQLVKKYTNPNFTTSPFKDGPLYWVDTPDNLSFDVSDFPNIMMNPTKADINNIYRQFIVTGTGNYLDYVSTNQVIVIEFENVDSNKTITFVREYMSKVFSSSTSCGDVGTSALNAYSTGDEEITINLQYQASVENISRSLPNFYVFITDKYMNIINPDEQDADTAIIKLDGDTKRYLILINKYFNNTTNIVGAYRLKYKKRDPINGVKFWNFDCFIPYFYKLEKITNILPEDLVKGLSESEVFKRENAANTYTIPQNKVVCFLPDKRYIHKPTDIMWKFINKTTNEVINPVTWRDADEVPFSPFDSRRDRSKYTTPKILQPLLGRYDFRKVVDKGYYDIEMIYRFGKKEEDKTKTVSSMFILS